MKAIGTLLLLKRVKLRRLSSNPSLNDIRIFTLTCFGTFVTIDCMKVSPSNNKSGEFLLFEKEWVRSFSLMIMAKSLRWPTQSHSNGRTVHLQRILDDIQAIKGTRSFADIDKRAYDFITRLVTPPSWATSSLYLTRATRQVSWLRQNQVL